MNKTVPMSVVVPVFNKESLLKRCLAAIRRSDFKEYELVVVDDGSQDDSLAVAKQFNPKIIEHRRNLGLSASRMSAYREAQGNIIVNIDSDVVIQKNTLSRINTCFSNHPQIDAVNGAFSKECFFNDYFSVYKNLYMYYIFHKLPDFITFLHGSIFAIRNSMVNYYESKDYYGEDTAFGQRLIEHGKTIFFMKEIEVVHMKKYDFRSLIKNDILVPYYWTSLFLANKGWRQFGRPKTGFAHASRSQMISVVLAPLIIFLIATSFLKAEIMPITIFISLLWLFLNARFIYFLARERGPLFGWQSLLFTFLDNNCMALGIFCGLMRISIAKMRFFK